MFNELLLIAHIFVIAAATFVALRLGKSALVAFSVTQMVLANIFVIKQIQLFGLAAASADAFIIGALLSFNLVNELYGPASARRMIPTTFFISIFYAVMSQIHLAYIPAAHDTTQESFNAIFSVAPWLVAGSIIVFAIVQLLDYLLYSFLKRLFAGRYLMLRNYMSLSCTQLADTIGFTLVLYALGVIEYPASVALVSYAIKIVIILVTTPLVTIFLALHRRLGSAATDL